MSDITAFRLVINILLIGLKTIDFCDIKFIKYLFLINLIISKIKISKISNNIDFNRNIWNCDFEFYK